ncbi:MAG: hypothetical protein M1268_03370 [Patescibacteria group bacterium]|nr:hypothetical protein [Patescibacteria group bacterium]
MKNAEKGSILLIVLIVILIIASAWLVRGVAPKISSKNLIGGAVNLVDKQTASGDKTLQLGTLSFAPPSPVPSPEHLKVFPTQTSTSNPVTTSTPVPGEYCPEDTPKRPDCECNPRDTQNLQCEGSSCPPNPDSSVKFCQYPPVISIRGNVQPNPEYQLHLNDPNCRILCLYKPVIYLYPTRPTIVNVSLDIPGSIYISDPLYPKDGWKNVTAFPDGTLIYKGKKYEELFYESKIDKINPPQNGIIIPKENLRIKLEEIITKLGLIKKEREEFLSFWVQKLNKLESPYVLFSVVDPVEKERIDKIEISPKPDTRIEFIAYFKPLYEPISITPLMLPESPPKRTGFTEVEWGGTIDR